VCGVGPRVQAGAGWTAEARGCASTVHIGRQFRLGTTQVMAAHTGFSGRKDPYAGRGHRSSLQRSASSLRFSAPSASSVSSVFALRTTVSMNSGVRRFHSSWPLLKLCTRSARRLAARAGSRQGLAGALSSDAKQSSSSSSGEDHTGASCTRRGQGRRAALTWLDINMLTKVGKRTTVCALKALPRARSRSLAPVREGGTRPRPQVALPPPSNCWSSGCVGQHGRAGPCNEPTAQPSNCAAQPRAVCQRGQ